MVNTIFHLHFLVTKQQKQPMHDMFEVSSDSDYSHDMNEIVDQIINKPVQTKKVKKLTKTRSPNGSNNEKNNAGTPVQRSIRRYGKIRKSVKSFSPQELPTKNVRHKYLYYRF